MKLITLLGQTSSGKSEMAIQLAMYLEAKNQKVCVIGCDSRQVYRGLNIGTGKIKGQWLDSIFIYENIPHFMIDFVDPEIEYNLQNYLWDFYTIINKIETDYEYAILVGGTGLYAKAIMERLDLGDVKGEFRTDYNNYKGELQALTKEELQDQVTAANIDINHSDFNNPVRLVSKLLKLKATKKNWLSKSQYYSFSKEYLFAIDINQELLKNKIEHRLFNRFDQGLITEIQKFQYLGEAKFMYLGLEYRQGSLYLNKQITELELRNNLLTENLRYAKRQFTWLKKQKNLIWIRNLNELIEKLEI